MSEHYDQLTEALRYRPVAVTAAQMREAADLLDAVTAEATRLRGDHGRLVTANAEVAAVNGTLQERVRVLEEGIKHAIAACQACGGRGYDVTDDGNGDIDKDPCSACWDLRELVQDHTDYPLESAAAPAEVGMCEKTRLCTLDAGHEGECDDIPF